MGYKFCLNSLWTYNFEFMMDSEWYDYMHIYMCAWDAYLFSFFVNHFGLSYLSFAKRKTTDMKQNLHWSSDQEHIVQVSLIYRHDINTRTTLK